MPSSSTGSASKLRAAALPLARTSAAPLCLSLLVALGFGLASFDNSLFFPEDVSELEVSLVQARMLQSRRKSSSAAVQVAGPSSAANQTGLVTDALGLEADRALQANFQGERVSNGWIAFAFLSTMAAAVQLAVGQGLGPLSKFAKSGEAAGDLVGDHAPAGPGVAKGTVALARPSHQPANGESPKKDVVSLETLRDEMSGRQASVAKPVPDVRLEDFINTGADDKVAIITSNGRQVTYKEFRERSEMVAAGLRGFLGPDATACGLFAEKGERGDELLYGIYGILKCGCAYVPLPPSFPADRIAYIIEDAKISVMVTGGSLKSTWDKSFGSLAVPVLDVSEQLALGGRRDDSCLAEARSRRNMSPDDVAVIFYTSGSTGKPKGVSLTHRAEATICLVFADTVLRSHDRVLCTHAYNFDSSIQSCIGTFTKGCTVVIGPKEGTDMEGMSRIFEHLSPTFADFVPSVYTTYVASYGIPQSLERVALGGEACPMSAWQGLWEAGKQPINEYGPTECSVGAVALFRRIPELEDKVRSVPIGRPHLWREAYIMSVPSEDGPDLDAGSRLLPFGGQGELWLGGPGLATGYQNLPEKTAAAFVEHPFAASEKAYRTGDLCQWLDTGDISFLGRIDTQIKLHGLRIEVEEIENVLRTEPSVVEAVVVIQAKDGGRDTDKRLLAWLSPEGADTAGALEACRKNLPKYMVPAAVQTLAEWPRNAARKIDRLALTERAKKLDWAAGAGPEVEFDEVADSMGAIRRVAKENSTIAQHLESILGFAVFLMVLDHWTDKHFTEGGGGIEAYRERYYDAATYFDGFQMSAFIVVVGILNAMSVNIEGTMDAHRLSWRDLRLIIVYLAWEYPLTEIYSAFLYIITLGTTNYLPWVARFGRSGTVRWFLLYLLAAKVYTVTTQRLWPSVQYLLPLGVTLYLDTVFFNEEATGQRTDVLWGYIANLVFLTHWGMPAFKHVLKLRDSLPQYQAARYGFTLAGWAAVWFLQTHLTLGLGTRMGVLLFPVQMVLTMVAIPDCAALRFVAKYTPALFLMHRHFYPIVVAGGVRVFGVLPLPGLYSATNGVLGTFGLAYAGADPTLCSLISILMLLAWFGGFLFLFVIPFSFWLSWIVGLISVSLQRLRW